MTAVAWIEKNWIYPKEDSSNQARLAWIEREFIYAVNGGGTKAFIKDGHIYLNQGGYTQYFIQDNWIYGPDTHKLPWL